MQTLQVCKVMNLLILIMCCDVVTVTLYLQAMHLTEVSAGSKQKINYNTRSLPRHFKIMSQQFNLVQSYYDVSKDTLYVSKCIVLMSQHAYMYANFQFLSGLYRSITCAFHIINIKNHLWNLLCYF